MLGDINSHKLLVILKTSAEVVKGEIDDGKETKAVEEEAPNGLLLLVQRC